MGAYDFILGGKAPQIESPTEAAQGALTMKQLATQSRAADEDQRTREVFNKNVATGADGTTSLNKSAVLSDLYKINPQKALDYQKMFADQDLDVLKKHTEAAKQLSWSISDPETYHQARAKAVELGLPNSDKIPEQYDPGFVKNWQIHTLEGEKQLDYQVKSRENQIKHEETSIKREQMQTDKVDKYARDMRGDMDPDRQRAGNFGDVSGRYLTGQRMKTLIGAFKDGNLPPAQMEELSLGLANMVSGQSGAARSQVEALVPSSAIGDKNKFMQWLANEPKGAGQQKFVQMMGHTVDREMDLSQDQLNEIRVKRLGFHEALKKMAPDQYGRILDSYGVDQSRIKGGAYQPRPAAPPPGADFHSMSDDEVDRAYKAAGGK